MGSPYGSRPALTHVSLFAGIGGIDLAAEWAGFQSVAMVERDPFCQKVLKKNFPGVPIYNDVTTFDATEFRGVGLVSGGFPCQPHSVAGARRASLDGRDLWGEFVRVVRESQPLWVLGENVRGLLSSEGGRFFGRVLRDLADAGYSVAWDCVSAADAGARHRRERVFFVAHAPVCGRDDAQTQRIAERCAREAGAIRRAMADALRAGRQELDAPAVAVGPGLARGRGHEDMADASGPRRRRGGAEEAPPARDETRLREPQRHGGSRGREQWLSEPGMGRVVDGLSRGLDDAARLRALGNAVVPQQVYPLLQAIANEIRSTRPSGVKTVEGGG
jgi:DNA (cytosine-5)-methyltransferase 1